MHLLMKTLCMHLHALIHVQHAHAHQSSEQFVCMCIYTLHRTTRASGMQSSIMETTKPVHSAASLVTRNRSSAMEAKRQAGMRPD